MQSHEDHAVYSDLFSSKRKCKPDGYNAVCVQYVALPCCLSAVQMAKGKQCKLLSTLILNSALILSEWSLNTALIAP
jgi:hypothetical protein